MLCVLQILSRIWDLKFNAGFEWLWEMYYYSLVCHRFKREQWPYTVDKQKISDIFYQIFCHESWPTTGIEPTTIGVVSQHTTTRPLPTSSLWCIPYYIDFDEINILLFIKFKILHDAIYGGGRGVNTYTLCKFTPISYYLLNYISKLLSPNSIRVSSRSSRYTVQY